MKVVVIDDSRLSVSALQNIIVKIGHKMVGSAFDGEAGVKVAKEHNPDVVCLDFVMPKIDGTATAKLLRKDVPSAKIIMVTQKELDADAKRAINAAAYVVKPITQDKIKTAFASL